MQTIFISSVQKELAEERRALKDYIEGDALLRRFFEVFLFEDLSASDRRADNVYLDQVDRCGLYVGLFGDQYGYEDAAGISPTEREFDRATSQGKTRLIFVKGADDKTRHPKMLALVHKAGNQLIRRRFTSIPELIGAVYASLTEHLDQCGIIQDRPFDERLCRDAAMDDLDATSVKSFVHLARAKRDFPLAEDAPMNDVLTHLGVLLDGKPTNAAMLLFGRTPQRFIPCAEVRCMHFHGTEVMRPAPFYRIFKGALFTQVEEAANFVLSVTNVSVGTRALGSQAPVRLEIPRDVIQEAIVNAIVHRDYTSNAAIQVSVFSDRVETWNPGELLPPLTPESLRVPHRSITRNHRICEAMFLAGYIEKYGTGTLMMIRESVRHALPEPVFKQCGGEFVAALGRDWLTEDVLVRLNLSDRQVRGVMHVKLHGRIANQAYRQLCGVSKATASRDLEALCELDVLERIGDTGKGTYYVLRPKGLTKSSSETKGSQRAHRAHLSTGTKTAEFTGIVGTRPRVKSPPKSPTSTPEVTPEVASMLNVIHGEMKRSEIQEKLGLMDEKHFRKRYQQPAVAAGLIEMTIPDKPRSSKQKYRLTDKGRTVLEGNVPEHKRDERK